MNLNEIKIEENFIRDNLYNPTFQQHPMNTDPYFNLIEITEEIWNIICLNILQIKKDSTLYFPEARLSLRKRITRSWDEITKLAKNNDIDKYFGDNADFVFMAGGAVLSTLLCVHRKDIDYFTIKEIMPYEIKTDGFEISPGVINFAHNRQLIKRLYKIPHEIVHSFDIDCCAILINRHGQIYGSKRAIYSMMTGINTVDFNYLSPSYEWRLIKYSTRGFSVSVPGVVNCDNIELVNQRTEYGLCVPDAVWSVADINDILVGSVLKALLMNATGFQKLLIASSVSDDHSLAKLANKQLSDYEAAKKDGNKVNGQIPLNDKFYQIDGTIFGDTYRGMLVEGEEKSRPFSKELESKILNIILSPYKKVKPGEQTTSTFHKIVLSDPNEWYKLDKSSLFEKTLYTMLYFKRIHDPPQLYDEKVLWFGPNTINLFVYHLARLVLNNKIYDEFNGFKITQQKIAYGEYMPKSITYRNKVYELNTGDQNNIIETFLRINTDFKTFSNEELELLNALLIKTRTKENNDRFSRRSDTIPIIETRNQTK